jgi:hypothetical protein
MKERDWHAASLAFFIHSDSIALCGAHFALLHNVFGCLGAVTRGREAFSAWEEAATAYSRVRIV